MATRTEKRPPTMKTLCALLGLALSAVASVAAPSTVGAFTSAGGNSIRAYGDEIA